MGEGKIRHSVNQGKHLGGLDKVVKAYVAQKSLGYRERQRERERMRERMNSSDLSRELNSAT